MARILKYELDAGVRGQQRIKMPAFSRPRSVAFQRERYGVVFTRITLVVWAVVHPESPEVEETFEVYRTYGDVEETPHHCFIGTAQTTNIHGVHVEAPGLEHYVAHVYWLDQSRR